jgi:hypothetical protein
LCYYFGHLDIVYFAVPGLVEGLSLNPGSDNIIVKWEKPNSNSDCVMNYIIEWVNPLVSGSKDTSSVSSDEFSYTIKDLDACVAYAVSVRTVNADGDGAEAVTDKTTTGNYHTHIILLCL